jgi:hypothetical protein
MKLFKKALVATAVIGAFSAQAVTVSSNKTAISQEGSDFGLKALVATTAGADDFVLDFVVDKLTPAASTITLTFDSSVSLEGITSSDTAVNNVIGTGTGEASIDGNGTATFGYGTGSFTFDRFNIGENADGEDTISFDVNLGNPLTASSAFRLTLANVDATNNATNGVAIGGEAQVCYESRDAADVLIEQGCSTISEVKSQFSFEVLDANEWDGRIERVEAQTFTRDSDLGSETADTLKFKVSNDETLAAALTVNTAVVTFTGNFADVTTNEITVVNTGTTDVQSTANASVSGEISFTIDAAAGVELVNTGVAQTGMVTFDAIGSGNAITIPQTGSINAEIEFFDTVSVGTTTTTVNGTSFTLNDAAGEWALDATVINVPYLPLLFTDTTSSVHIANDGTTAANVMATIVTYCDAIKLDTCVDQTRSESVDLGTVPANTVAKIRQGALAEAFGITEATKVSVTFNIDAYAEDISAYASVENSGGRTEVSNSQAKVDGK